MSLSDKGRVYDSQVRHYVTVDIGLNVSSGVHSCGCVVHRLQYYWSSLSITIISLVHIGAREQLLHLVMSLNWQRSR